MRAGVNGTRRMRTPVASKIALLMAAAVGREEGSPAPRRGDLRVIQKHHIDLGEHPTIALPDRCSNPRW